MTGLGTVDRLRRDEDLLAGAAERLGVAPDEVVTGIDKRLEEIKDLRDELKALKRQTATGQAGALAGQAQSTASSWPGSTASTATACGTSRSPCATSRRRAGGRASSASPTAGASALVSAVTPDSGLNAGELIADAAKTVGGGGGKAADLAVAGGRDATKIDEALEQARTAAGVA